MKNFWIQLCLFISVQTVMAQSTPDGYRNTTADVRLGTENAVMEAVRISGDDVIFDGFLDDDIWQKAPFATGFTQRFPDDGSSATQETEIRLLYTDSAIYAGIMAYDTHPDSIKAPLFRRDGMHSTDWVYISFDSYDDKRTAFSFAINPRGVQKDILYFDDTNEDVLGMLFGKQKPRYLKTAGLQN